MAGDPVLTKLDAKIAEKEAELGELRKAAWEKRNAILVEQAANATLEKLLEAYERK